MADWQNRDMTTAQTKAADAAARQNQWMNILKGAVYGSYLDDSVAKPLAGIGLVAYLLNQRHANKVAGEEAAARRQLDGIGQGIGVPAKAAAYAYAPANYISDRANLGIAQNMAGWNGAPKTAAAQGIQAAQDAIAADRYYSPWMNRGTLGGLGQFEQSGGADILANAVGTAGSGLGDAAAGGATPEQLAAYDSLTRKGNLF